jgi:hypothetical protein
MAEWTADQIRAGLKITYPYHGKDVYLLVRITKTQNFVFVCLTRNCISLGQHTADEVANILTVYDAEEVGEKL